MEYTLTTEQRNALQPFERHLHTALYASYVVGLDNTTSKLFFDTYNEVFNEHERNMSCNFCVMQVCTRLARLYYNTPAPEKPAPEVTKLTHKK